MRVLSALTPSTASQLLHELVHHRVVQALRQGVVLVLVLHSRHFVLKEVYLQLGVRVHVVVHVQLLHGVGGLFLGGIGHGRLGQSPGISIGVGGLLLHAPHDVTVLSADLL